MPWARGEVALKALHCGRLIDGVHDEVRNDVILLVEGERISALLDSRKTLPEGFDLIDLSSKTCFPGLSTPHQYPMSNDRFDSYLRAI